MKCNKCEGTGHEGKFAEIEGGCCATAKACTSCDGTGCHQDPEIELLREVVDYFTEMVANVMAELDLDHLGAVKFIRGAVGDKLALMRQREDQ